MIFILYGKILCKKLISKSYNIHHLMVLKTFPYKSCGSMTNFEKFNKYNKNNKNIINII